MASCIIYKKHNQANTDKLQYRIGFHFRPSKELKPTESTRFHHSKSAGLVTIELGGWRAFNELVDSLGMILTYSLIAGLMLAAAGMIYTERTGGPYGWYASAAVAIFLTLVLETRLREIRDRMPRP